MNERGFKMGTQASFIRMANSKDFDRLLKYIRNQGKNKFDPDTTEFEPWIEIHSVVTLLQPIKGNLGYMCMPYEKYSFPVGERFLYVYGERSMQRSSYDFFEKCNRVPEIYLERLEIYFAQCFPADRIFPQRGKSKIALVEPFKWQL